MAVCLDWRIVIDSALIARRDERLIDTTLHQERPDSFGTPAGQAAVDALTAGCRVCRTCDSYPQAMSPGNSCKDIDVQQLGDLREFIRTHSEKEEDRRTDRLHAILHRRQVALDGTAIIEMVIAT